MDSWNFVARKSPRRSVFSVYREGRGKVRDLSKIIQLFNKDPGLSISSYQMLILLADGYVLSHSLHSLAYMLPWVSEALSELLWLNNLELEDFWIPPYQVYKVILTWLNPRAQMSPRPLFFLISVQANFACQVWCHQHPYLHSTLVWMNTLLGDRCQRGFSLAQLVSYDPSCVP